MSWNTLGCQETSWLIRMLDSLLTLDGFVWHVGYRVKVLNGQPSTNGWANPEDQCIVGGVPSILCLHLTKKLVGLALYSQVQLQSTSVFFNRKSSFELAYSYETITPDSWGGSKVEDRGENGMSFITSLLIGMRWCICPPHEEVCRLKEMSFGVPSWGRGFVEGHSVSVEEVALSRCAQRLDCLIWWAFRYFSEGRKCSSSFGSSQLAEASFYFPCECLEALPLRPHWSFEGEDESSFMDCL